MLLLLVLIIGSSLAPSHKAINRERVEHVDLIEYNQCGPLSQLIFWDWSPDYRRYNCQGWDFSHGLQIDRNAAGYSVRVRGSRIVSKLLIKTHTVKDPERENLAIFPHEFRRSLW